MKSILIVGATSAIGTAILDEVVNSEGVLYLVGRNHQRLLTLASDAETRGNLKVEVRQADFAKEEDWESFGEWLANLAEVDEAFILPGILTKEDASYSEVRSGLSVNFLAPAMISRILAEKMASGSGGAIVVVGSVAGDRGRQSNALYGAQKGALEIYIEGLAHRVFHLNRKVRVSLIKPGLVKSPMTSHLKQSLLFSEPSIVARQALKVVAGPRSRVCYSPRWWSLIMLVVKLLPKPLFWRSRL